MSSWYNKSNEEGEDEVEDDDEEDEYKSFNDKIIFLVDSREDMFQINSQMEIKYLNCLKLIMEVMKSKIVANDNSAIGIVFFGTREKSSDSSCDSVYTLFSPSIPCAEQIRQLQRFIDDVETFHSEIGSLSNTATNHFQRHNGIIHDILPYCPLKESLSICQELFRNDSANKATDLKRIWIFTNDDNPNPVAPTHKQQQMLQHGQQSHKGVKKPKQEVTNQDQIITIAKDCTDTGITISLFHMNNYSCQQSYTFDPKLFYYKILQYRGSKSYNNSNDDDQFDLLPNNEDEDISSRIQAAGDEGFDTMLVHMRKKMFRKRVLGNYFLRFGPFCDDSSQTLLPYSTENLLPDANACSQHYQNSSCKISVQLYKLFSIAKKPIHKYLYAPTNEPMKVMTFYIDAFTGEQLSDDRIDTCLEFGNVKIPVSATEYSQIKKGDDVNQNTATADHSDINMICFTALQNLPQLLNIESSYYMYPNDSIIKNSKKLYVSMLAYMHQQQLCGLVRFTRTKSSTSRLAAIIPYLNLDIINGVEGNEEEFCYGLHIVPLPFRDEIRRNPSPISSDILQMVIRSSAHMNQEIVDNNKSSGNTNSQDNCYENVSKEIKVWEELIDHFQVSPTTASTMEEQEQSNDGHKGDSSTELISTRLYWQYYQSPVMQQFYSLLQAVALAQTAPDWVASEHDNLHAESKLISDPLMQAITSEISSVFGITESAIEEMENQRTGGSATGKGSSAVSGVRKRKAEKSDVIENSGTPVAVAAEEILGGRAMWIDMAHTGSLGKVTVNELKSICSVLKLPVSGAKAVLVDRITNALKQIK